MDWRLSVLALWLLQHTAGQVLPFENIEDFHNLDDNIIGDESSDASSSAVNLYEDIKLEQLGKMLANVLLEPWPGGVSPVLYVEDQEPQENSKESLNGVPMLKRSRYYRKYPWKRQNSRYEPENKYLCQPSKEDVFRLLVALHDARRGSRGQMVNFCSRKRPASSVFTNIRFLG